jgi:MoaA/NifB/PqqE/SkfB family radical SAM enzyme
MDAYGPDATATGAALAAQGRAAEAERWFRRALAAEPANTRAALGLARLLLKRQDLPGAIAALRPAADAAPHDPALFTAYREFGFALYRAWHWEDAAPWLDRAAALAPWDQALAALRARIRRPAWLAPEVHDPQLGRTLRRHAPRETDGYSFVIDIVGTCNLRCPTCPVGNSALGGRPIGFMEYAQFERIIDKIRAETPVPDPRISLFNWGEPLLHPELPRFLALLHRHGLRSYLSSNLNIRRGLEEALRANPTDLNISLSGFTQEHYGRTHARGDVELVKRNMRLIRTLIDRHRLSTHVWVGHHLYRSSAHEMEPLRRLCAELGFDHEPIQAQYMPLERLAELLDGAPPPHPAVVADLPVPPAERQARIDAVRSGRYDCELRFSQTVINHDGQVALCCAVYDADNMLGAAFLDHDLAALEQRKYRHHFCATCMGRNLHHAPAELFPQEALPEA